MVKIFQSNFFDTKCKKISTKVLSAVFRFDRDLFFLAAGVSMNIRITELQAIRITPISGMQHWLRVKN
jgi:hypothetical protein